MKKISILLAAILTLTACHKEPTIEVTGNTERDIFYTVAGDSGLSVFSGNTIHLNNEAEWEALLDQFCNYAQDGEQVIFCNTGHTGQTQAKSGSSNTPTSITTTNRDELKEWMKEMEKAGKTVSVTYDDGTGTWNGRAYANISNQDPQAEAQSYNGTITFVATPELDQPPLGGVVMALQVGAADTYVITVHGMMLWFDNDTPDDFMRLLQDAPATLTGVTGSHTDLSGNTFSSIDLVVPEDGVIEF